VVRSAVVPTNLGLAIQSAASSVVRTVEISMANVRVLARHPYVAAAHAGGRIHSDRLELLLRMAKGQTGQAFAEDEEVLVDKVAQADSLRAAEQILTDWRDTVGASVVLACTPSRRAQTSSARSALTGRRCGPSRSLDRCWQRWHRLLHAAIPHPPSRARRARRVHRRHQASGAGLLRSCSGQRGGDDRRNGLDDELTATIGDGACDDWRGRDHEPDGPAITHDDRSDHDDHAASADHPVAGRP
jgi:hypothetical protein